MALALTVTPGTVIAADQSISADDLNLLGAPDVTLPDGSIGGTQIDVDSVVAAIGDAVRGTNFLPVGTFQQDLFASSAITCAVDVKTPIHPGWYVSPAGAGVAAIVSGRTSANTTLIGGRCGVKITGDAALTTLQLGTWVPPGLAQEISGSSITFSIYIWNNTGAFTPALKVYCAATNGDESSTALQATVTGQACTVGAWTRITFTFDASATTNFNNGAHLAVQVTKTASVLQSGTEYAVFADAQIDTGTTETTLIPVPPLVNPVPAGVVFPFAGPSTAVPPGWLYCNGASVLRAQYPRLFAAIGTAYGAADGTHFNVPDMAGRTWVGAEIAGASAGRMEVSITAASSSGDTITVASGAADSLRLGMGAFGNAYIPAGAYVIAITATTIQLSAATTGSVTGTVRFSKLGAEDPQTLGADGNGPSYGARLLSFTKGACATASSTTLTVPNTTDLACGMTVSGTNIPTGTTIAAFISATSVRLSAAATGTTSGLTMTFGINAPEGDQMLEWERLKGTIVIAGCGWGIDTSAPYKLDINAPETGIPYVDKLSVGMAVSGDTIPANSYITVIGVGEVEINNSVTAASTSPTATDVTFTKVSTARATTRTPDTLPALIGNYIIKT